MCDLISLLAPWCQILESKNIYDKCSLFFSPYKWFLKILFLETARRLERRQDLRKVVVRVTLPNYSIYNEISCTTTLKTSLSPWLEWGWYVCRSISIWLMRSWRHIVSNLKSTSTVNTKVPCRSTHISANRKWSQIISEAVWDKAQYSTSTEEQETVDCFLHFQEIKEEPRKVQKPIVDRHMSTHSSLLTSLAYNLNCTILTTFSDL